jgi:hypothetical protein
MRALLQFLAVFYTLVGPGLTVALPEGGHIVSLKSHPVPLRRGRFGKRSGDVNVPLDVQYNGTELQV